MNWSDRQEALRCESCPAKFESRDALAMHMLEHSFIAEAAAAVVSERRAGGRFFQDRALRWQEERMAMLARGLAGARCHQCYKVFGDHDSLAMHMLSHTSRQDDKSQSGQDNTGWSRPDRREQRRMLESHHCPQCGAAFIQRELLLLHLSTQHKPVRKYPLDLSMSKRRKRSHSGDKDAADTDTLQPSPATRQSLPTATADAGLKTEQQEGDNYNRASVIQTSQSAQSKVQAEAVKETVGSSGGHQEAPLSLGGIGAVHRLSGQAYYPCTRCNIIFLDRAMFHLHAGLHNRSAPWQCNVCGKRCASPLEFAAHVIHA